MSIAVITMVNITSNTTVANLTHSTAIISKSTKTAIPTTTATTAPVAVEIPHAICYSLRAYNGMNLLQCYEVNSSDSRGIAGLCNVEETGFMRENGVSLCNASDYFCYNDTDLCYNSSALPNTTCIVNESNASWCDNGIVIANATKNASRVIMLATSINQLVSARPYIGVYPNISNPYGMQLFDARGVKSAIIMPQVTNTSLTNISMTILQSITVLARSLVKNNVIVNNIFGFPTQIYLLDSLIFTLLPCSVDWPIISGIVREIDFNDKTFANQTYQITYYSNTSNICYSDIVNQMMNTSVLLYGSEYLNCVSLGELLLVCTGNGLNMSNSTMSKVGLA